MFRPLVYRQGRGFGKGTDVANMSKDVVVTIPKKFGLNNWIAEGDLPGEPWTGYLSNFYISGPKPNCQPGDRVYVVFNGNLRGFAPLVRLDWNGFYGSFIRGGNAEAVTIDEYIRGFRGWKYRWWDRSQESPFYEWQTP